MGCGASAAAQTQSIPMELTPRRASALSDLEHRYSATSLFWRLSQKGDYGCRQRVRPPSQSCKEWSVSLHSPIMPPAVATTKFRCRIIRIDARKHQLGFAWVMDLGDVWFNDEETVAEEGEEGTPKRSNAYSVAKQLWSGEQLLSTHKRRVGALDLGLEVFIETPQTQSVLFEFGSQDERDKFVSEIWVRQKDMPSTPRWGFQVRVRSPLGLSYGPTTALDETKVGEEVRTRERKKFESSTPSEQKLAKTIHKFRSAESVSDLDGKTNTAHTSKGPVPLRRQLYEWEEQFLRWATETWSNRALTNFEYLAILNQLSGRSHHDQGKYPIFPWLLHTAAMRNSTMEMDPSHCRNLSKPIGCSDEMAEARVKRNFEEGRLQAHHGSVYSNPGHTLYFLFRLQPFLSEFLAFFSGKFDVADRLFFSIPVSWEAGNGRTKELPPEFFTQPEVFENLNQLELGDLSDGGTVSHVLFPEWAKSDPELFIARHRALLESEMVSQSLNLWIDLVFGHKAAGKAAILASNVFIPPAYATLNALTEDSKIIHDYASMFGQVPDQLFDSEHPQRKSKQTHPLESAWADLANGSSEAEVTWDFSSAVVSVGGHLPNYFVVTDSQTECPVAVSNSGSAYVLSELHNSAGDVDTPKASNSIRASPAPTLSPSVCPLSVLRSDDTGNNSTPLSSFVATAVDEGNETMFGVNKDLVLVQMAIVDDAYVRQIATIEASDESFELDKAKIHFTAVATSSKHDATFLGVSDGSVWLFSSSNLVAVDTIDVLPLSLTHEMEVKAFSRFSQHGHICSVSEDTVVVWTVSGQAFVKLSVDRARERLNSPEDAADKGFSQACLCVTWDWCEEPFLATVVGSRVLALWSVEYSDIDEVHVHSVESRGLQCVAQFTLPTDEEVSCLHVDRGENTHIVFVGYKSGRVDLLSHKQPEPVDNKG